MVARLGHLPKLAHAPLTELHILPLRALTRYLTNLLRFTNFAQHYRATLNTHFSSVIPWSSGQSNGLIIGRSRVRSRPPPTIFLSEFSPPAASYSPKRLLTTVNGQRSTVNGQHGNGKQDKDDKIYDKIYKDIQHS